MPEVDFNPLHSRRRVVVYYALSLGCVIALMALFDNLRSKPVEETITLDSNAARISPVTPIVTSSELPSVDRDIETAGDRVAAAVLYLKRRQNEPALNALQQAQVAANRALTRNPEGSKIRDQLVATNQEIDTVKDLIKKGKIGHATRELRDVDQKLEEVSY